MRSGSKGRNPSLAIALDLGGTKIAAALINTRGKILRKIKVWTDRRDAEAPIRQLIALARQLLQEVPPEAVRGIGVAVPAVVDPSRGLVRWAPNLPGWQDVPLREQMERALGLPVWVDFDGHLAALGEHWRGAGRGAQNMVFVIIGTGIGGGMILGGRLHRGHTNIAGGIGWLVVDRQAAQTPEARAIGCLESLAAGPAIARRASVFMGPDVSAEAVFQAAAGGDPKARALLEEVAITLGLGIANIVSLLNPELVVLGGGVGAASGLFLDLIRQVVREHAQPVCAEVVRIVPAALGDESSLLGAARLVFQQRASHRIEGQPLAGI